MYMLTNIVVKLKINVGNSLQGVYISLEKKLDIFN